MRMAVPNLAASDSQLECENTSCIASDVKEESTHVANIGIGPLKSMFNKDSASSGTRPTVSSGSFQ